MKIKLLILSRSVVNHSSNGSFTFNQWTILGNHKKCLNRFIVKKIIDRIGIKCLFNQAQSLDKALPVKKTINLDL